jgi:hypothetical protein
MRGPLDDDLSTPWVFAGPRPFSSGEADSRRSVRPIRLPTVSPADPRPELGPRSLDPDRRFCGAFAELIRDLSSPTDFCNCLRRAGNQTRALSDPRRDGDLDLLPFLTWHALSLAEAVTRGEPRYVRWRRPQCWFLPLARVCPAVMPPSPPHLRELAPAERSEDRRARVEGPSEGRVPGRMRRCLVPASGAYA